jgi:hypothetical protein
VPQKPAFVAKKNYIIGFVGAVALVTSYLVYQNRC